MEIVDFADAPDSGQARADFLEREMVRSALHENMERFADQPDAAPGDQAAEENADDRVDDFPARGPDEKSGGDDADAAEGIPDDMEIGSPGVQVFVPGAMEDCGNQNIDGQSGDRDQKHRAGPDVQGRLHAAKGLSDDEDGGQSEAQAVEQGGEDLESVPAERPPQGAGLGG